VNDPRISQHDATNGPLRLSVLDQSPIAKGSTGAQALHNSVDLAKLADELGYHRYWVAEHHGTPALACASPEVLIAAIASQTSTRLRVGSGGVMLPHYSPLKVAETFNMLDGLYAGRIDLGVGRAAGTDPKTALALQRDRSRRMPDDFRQHLEELLAYVWNRMPPEHPFARLAALPGRPGKPDVWLLGSSPQSGIWAAELGLAYAFADFINADGAMTAAQYRETFVPSNELPAPRTAVAVWAICADTDEEARTLSASFRMLMSLMHRGQLIPVPPVEEALEFLKCPRSGLDRIATGRRIITGSPPTVRAGLEAVAREYGAEEVLVVNVVHDHLARRRSYELIAQEFGLTKERAAAHA